VAAHAKSRDVIKRAIEFGVDTIEHADLSPDDTDIFHLMAERGVFLVPTLSLYHWVGSEGGHWGIFEGGRDAAAAMLPQRQAMVGAAFAAGVKVATGTDTGSSMALGKNAMELSLLVAAGLSPLEAIEAATRVAAEALGVAGAVGTLESGKLADFIVVQGNPCEDVSLLHTTRPERVFFTAAGGVGAT
jgi:imidazolonepropionase-like amidohydrolase